MGKSGFRTSARSFENKDYYKILGLQRTSTKADIKKKYFELAKKYHPDVNKEKDAESKFKDISEAYEVLEDENKRQIYDSYGSDAVNNMNNAGGGGGTQGDPFGGFGGFNRGGGGFQGFHHAGNINQEDLFDLFEQHFGGGFSSRRQGPRRGKDTQMELNLSFFEAVNGCEREINVDYMARSITKNGKETKVRRTRKVNISIPAGVDSGIVLRVGGKGSEGDAEMPAGDLMVHLSVMPDPYFKRNGHDIHVEIPISITQAVLGSVVEVLTIDGAVDMKLPAGTQPDGQLVLKGKGIKSFDGMGRGNQYVHIKIQIPRKVTETQKNLLKDFEEEEKYHGNSIETKSKSFISAAYKRLKDFMGVSERKEESKKKERTGKVKA